jgi:hypothetical protein
MNLVSWLRISVDHLRKRWLLVVESTAAVTVAWFLDTRFIGHRPHRRRRWAMHCARSPLQCAPSIRRSLPRWRGRRRRQSAVSGKPRRPALNALRVAVRALAGNPPLPVVMIVGQLRLTAIDLMRESVQTTARF